MVWGSAQAPNRVLPTRPRGGTAPSGESPSARILAAQWRGWPSGTMRRFRSPGWFDAGLLSVKPDRNHVAEGGGMTDGPRVAVIGLDCAPAKLVFGDLLDEIPNIRKLMESGMHGDLASITPPITVPAWACSMSGNTPGQLGIYGFRNRKDNTYDGLSIVTSNSIKAPAVWDELGAQGMRSVLIGVPPGFPPPKEFPGWRVGCFLTPPSAERFAFPQELEVEITDE